jgi:DNA-binding beta-propeller fold protein YncE
VVALDLVDRGVARIPLPLAQLSSDFEKYMLWSLAITPDGATLYATNPALGVIDEIDARKLSLRRTGQITVARTSPDALAALWQMLLPGADAKRYLVGGAALSPDGATLYAAAHDGLAVIDTATLASRAVWQPWTHQFDTLRLTADGRRLYAMDNMAGRLMIIDTSSGASLGEVKLQYVPAILRIDPA